jgi:DNA-binding transcriptional regulator YiaG
VAKLETVMKEAIARGARRQVRVLVLPLRREVIRLRRKVGALQGMLTTLRRDAAALKRLVAAAPPLVRAARLSPRLVRSLRNRLGLSQMALARLVGVSAAAVGHWEAGASTPTGQNRATVVALRKVGKREVKGLLATRLKETTPRASRARTRRRAR